VVDVGVSAQPTRNVRTRREGRISFFIGLF
jgi:hypothetical protein